MPRVIKARVVEPQGDIGVDAAALIETIKEDTGIPDISTNRKPLNRRPHLPPLV